MYTVAFRLCLVVACALLAACSNPTEPTPRLHCGNVWGGTTVHCDRN